MSLGSNVGQMLVVVQKAEKLGERENARLYFPQRENEKMKMMNITLKICFSLISQIACLFLGLKSNQIYSDHSGPNLCLLQAQVFKSCSFRQ